MHIHCQIPSLRYCTKLCFITGTYCGCGQLVHVQVRIFMACTRVVHFTSHYFYNVTNSPNYSASKLSTAARIYLLGKLDRHQQLRLNERSWNKNTSRTTNVHSDLFTDFVELVRNVNITPFMYRNQWVEYLSFTVKCSLLRITHSKENPYIPDGGRGRGEFDGKLKARCYWVSWQEHKQQHCTYIQVSLSTSQCSKYILTKWVCSQLNWQ